MVGAAVFRGAAAFGGAEVFRGALRAGGSTSRSRGVNMRENSPMALTVRCGPATAALRRAMQALHYSGSISPVFTFTIGKPLSASSRFPPAKYEGLPSLSFDSRNLERT